MEQRLSTQTLRSGQLWGPMFQFCSVHIRSIKHWVNKNGKWKRENCELNTRRRFMRRIGPFITYFVPFITRFVPFITYFVHFITYFLFITYSIFALFYSSLICRYQVQEYFRRQGDEFDASGSGYWVPAPFRILSNIHRWFQTGLALPNVSGALTPHGFIT